MCECCAHLLHFYLLIVCRVLHGIPISAFITSDDSVGIWMMIFPWISSKSLEHTLGEQDLISCGNWAWAELSLSLTFSRISLKASDLRRNDLVDAAADSTLGCFAWMNVSGCKCTCSTKLNFVVCSCLCTLVSPVHLSSFKDDVVFCTGSQWLLG